MLLYDECLNIIILLLISLDIGATFRHLLIEFKFETFALQRAVDI